MATPCGVILDAVTKKLEDAARAYRRAEARLTDARAELASAIYEAVTEDGERQAAVARTTGYAREHVRRILDAEIERRAKLAAGSAE